GSGGRITLVGDACHPTLPFLAQGAVMAIEDGFILARCLEKYALDHTRAFSSYEAARQERTRKIVLGSAENAKRFHDKRLTDASSAEAFVNRELARRACAGQVRMVVRLQCGLRGHLSAGKCPVSGG